jgi:DNA polymerase (family 10)
VLRQLRALHATAPWILRESAIADLPADLRWLFESGAVTVRQLAALHRTLGVVSAGDVAAAIRDGVLGQVPGLEEPAQGAIAEALSTLRRAVPRVALGRAVALAERVLAELRAVPGVAWALPSGSLRRAQDTIGDIELVAATERPAAAIDAVLQMKEVTRTLHRSAWRVYVRHERVQIGVRLAEPSRAGALLLTGTGSRDHLTALCDRARQSGRQLTADGLRGSDGRIVPAATEEELYALLGLPFIPPEIREDGEEVAAAARGEMPALVARADIQGDLHMHTDFSDGRDTVEAMVDTCRSLGYRYLAITDHSPHSAASRNLSNGSIARQADRIAALRERHPDIAILHGCEVDIRPDGRLDFPDAVLERLDIVLASLHEGAGQGPDELLRRYRDAMAHPLVTMITHPTNRLVPHRSGYRLDYDRLFELAAETGTIVEVDGAPAHLDLDGSLARRAVAAGVMIAVNSDCHRAEMLARQMELGVATARRGWLERRHVVNTQPLAEVLTVIAAKRRG